MIFLLFFNVKAIFAHVAKESGWEEQAQKQNSKPAFTKPASTPFISDMTISV